MAAARARGALACPSSARHCASFAWRTRLPRKPKWRILWNPLMQCTALEALCRAQGYVVLLNGNAAVTASSGPIVVHNPAPAHRGSTEVLAHRVRWSAPFQAVSVQRSSARERFERTNRPQDYVAQYESIRHRSGLISKGCMTHQPQNLHNAEVYIKHIGKISMRIAWSSGWSARSKLRHDPDGRGHPERSENRGAASGVP